MAHKGKTALVTGIGSGLGQVIAETMLKNEINLVGCEINSASIADFKAKIAAAYPNATSLLVECDVTSSSALDDLFAQAEKTFGKVDYIVNSAGIMDKFDPVGDMDEQMWERVMAVNATAPAMITKRAVNLMIKTSTKGSIVNICSIAGFRGFSAGEFRAAYTASKHALVGVTKNTAAFYAPKGIRCNAIMAGAMATNIANHFVNGVNTEGFALMQKTFPEVVARACDLAKMAKLVLYLCSDDAEMINGATMTADCAMTSN
ncbi:putative short chain dehydrogenase/oxidoreductase [Acrodontium crateriforme]|uniref:Short chain dehydrogenase/oxidoreductase n=1 Tax=Acrodontium crateriforme TaxID=150365 RepID=A0AAQ3LWK6_9PEZI|nr:putative short chain dehydrogenase/oxidoreductase [Acrodontium crateriforme]